LACQKGDNSDSPSTHARRGWRQGSGGGRPDQPAGQRGICRASDGRGDPRPVGYKGDKGRSGGILYPATIAQRIEAIRAAVDRWGGEIEVLHAGVEAFTPIPGSRVVFDPPYLGRTGYGVACSRDLVLDVATRHRAAGAVVAVCEAEPLPLAGWHHLELPRGAKSAEWLTLDRPPFRAVQQVAMFGAK